MSMAEERTELSRRASANQESRVSQSQQAKEHVTESSEEEESHKQRPLGVRIMFWLLRKSIVPFIMLIMLVAGLYVGYTVLGKQPGDEVFKWSTWQHMYDLVFSDT
ncbi:DNA-directed RNA polymerase subunit beta [Paenibacillus sp. NEAU-GSW1]|uniref:DNA-directed RNA polymerase subunit beta n=1 Tax=Paenibacillus sp. NEAU-GSW1 TaxID=2682486 RepID=UPI001564CC07|nr:DNA-directed RNA polymerase subunit beta [Paenibacillus sp. NEAU-GSW1]